MAETESSSTPFDRTMAGAKSLSSSLKRIENDIDKDTVNASEETAQFLQHCKKRCCGLLQKAQDKDVTIETLISILRDTAHMVLDYTYLDETLLVEAEFPPDRCVSRIAAIQEQLGQIFQVAKSCCEDKTVLESLGEELVECIHWRKGALLYMFSHTVEANSPHSDPAYYRQCLEEGVAHLEKMLSTRQPTAVPDSISSSDTLQLFSQGVYSDTHLLAMMYAAEMCYWHQRAADKKLFTLASGDGSNPSFGARQQGLRHLSSYLEAVKGPLKDQDWNTGRAEELQQYLRQDL